MNTHEFVLPFPPSQNHYYRHVGHMVKISKGGRIYRKDVIDAMIEQELAGKKIKTRLHVSIILNPPSNHRRDLDNFLKVPLDAITHSDFWLDDSQIDSLTISRGVKSKIGYISVLVKEVGE